MLSVGRSKIAAMGPQRYVTSVNGRAGWRGITRQASLVVALFAITIGLWFAFIALFGPIGPVWPRIVHAGYGEGVALIILNVAAFAGIVIVTMLLRRKRLTGAIHVLGIAPFSWRAILVTLVAVCVAVAMLYVLSYRPRITSYTALLGEAFIGPFVEEVLFRGFLYRQFRRWVGLPFWLAAALSSVPFALEHVNQGSSITLMWEILGWTFAGGIVFCWLVERWRCIWGAWAVHAGLNFTAAAFPLGGATAALNLTGNVQRLLVVVLVVIGTLWVTRGNKKVVADLDAEPPRST